MHRFSSLYDKYPEMWLLGQMMIMFLTLQEAEPVFQSGSTILYPH